MLKTKDLVPEVYTRMSRDFQLIGHIYEIIFNYLKTNIDTISNLPLSKNSDPRLLELVCSTLGFEISHEYDQDQLAKLCSIFVQLMRNKGNLDAIVMVLNMLCNLAGAEDECYIAQDEENPWELYLFVPTEVTNFVLLRDVMNYIMPSGVLYRIISTTVIETTIKTLLKNSDSVTVVRKAADCLQSRTFKTSDKDKLSDGKYYENTDGAYSIAQSISTFKSKDTIK